MPSKNNTLKENTSNSKTSIQSSKVKIIDVEKSYDKKDDIFTVKKKPVMNNYFYDNTLELKNKKNVIDTDA